MAAGVEAMGLKVYGDRDHKMFNATGAFIPDGVNGESLRKRMREEFEIEIGTSFGPLAGKIWRIGTMAGECAAASCGAYADGAGDGAAARGISSGGVWSGCGAGGL
jgi:aspartate aminotransferase-like enzyme